jgi:GNAT superfamily N-acetyltransferase
MGRPSIVMPRQFRPSCEAGLRYNLSFSWKQFGKFAELALVLHGEVSGGAMEAISPTFTLATAADRDLVLALMGEFYAIEHLPFDEAVASASLEALLGDRRLGRLFLIAIGEEVVGYVALTFGFSLEFRGRFALLDEIYLREAARGRGLGRASLRFVEHVCRGEGIAAIRLEVSRANTTAQAVYRRAGYDDHARDLLTKWVLPQV